jgi:hypothetical protein
MRIYFQDLKAEVQEDIFYELVERVKGEEPNYQERAEELGMDTQDYLTEQADYIINTGNYGVDMNF